MASESGVPDNPAPPQLPVIIAAAEQNVEEKLEQLEVKTGSALEQDEQVKMVSAEESSAPLVKQDESIIIETSTNKVEEKPEIVEEIPEEAKDEEHELEVVDTTETCEQVLANSKEDEKLKQESVKEESIEVIEKSLEDAELAPENTEDEVKPEEENIIDTDKIKDGQDQLKEEAPTKPVKQSNNLISKVKHSLVKAKKAIMGKSPTTPNSIATETKG